MWLEFDLDLDVVVMLVDDGVELIKIGVVKVVVVDLIVLIVEIWVVVEYDVQGALQFSVEQQTFVIEPTFGMFRFEGHVLAVLQSYIIAV